MSMLPFQHHLIKGEQVIWMRWLSSYQPLLIYLSGKTFQNTGFEVSHLAMKRLDNFAWWCLGCHPRTVANYLLLWFISHWPSFCYTFSSSWNWIPMGWCEFYAHMDFNCFIHNTFSCIVAVCFLFIFLHFLNCIDCILLNMLCLIT